MFYFKYAFIAYIVLCLIVVLNFLKTIYIKRKAQENNKIFKILIGTDILIDMPDIKVYGGRGKLCICKLGFMGLKPNA